MQVWLYLILVGVMYLIPMYTSLRPLDLWYLHDKHTKESPEVGLIRRVWSCGAAFQQSTERAATWTWDYGIERSSKYENFMKGKINIC